MTEPVPDSAAGRPRIRIALLALLGVAAVGVAAAAVSGRLGGGHATAERPAPPARTTVKVHRTTLSEGKTVSGTLAYSSAQALTPRLTGTVTALPAVGKVIGAGGTLFQVDNQPVVLMTGTVPAYRPLAAGTKGPDVRQLERNLSDLGYSGFTVDDDFTDATGAAVRRWQKDHGLKQTGSVELGRVVFRPGPLRVATHHAALGDALAGGPVYDTSGTDQHVNVKVTNQDSDLAHEGASVAVVLSKDGKTTPGKITKVGEPDGDGLEAKIPVTITVANQRALSGLPGKTVDVRFIAAKHPNVLAVPIVALLAVGDSGYGVEVVTGAQSRIVEVKVGLFADTMVEISGDGISEGTEVVAASA